ncbi:MAG TPA: hypothetical protein P5277_02955 [Candidatus Paceibacterota bacterium]|nr:hypothetical protein [Candidatus Paceibacterota bacterium]
MTTQKLNSFSNRERMIEVAKRIAERERQEREELERKAKETPQTQTDIYPVNINSTIDYWEIDGVKYRGKDCTVRLAKALLDNGIKKTQDDWAEYSIKARERGDFYVADMPLHHATFYALSKLDTDESQEAREFVKNQMRAKYLMTLTRINYNPTGKDNVIHNYKIPNEQYQIDTDFVGKDGFISKVSPKDYLEYILGTQNVNEIDAVYQKINQTPAYILRLNSKPKNKDECVAGFYANSGWAALYCSGGPGSSSASLGVFASY